MDAKLLAYLFSLSREKEDFGRMIEEWDVLHRDKDDGWSQCPCGTHIKEKCFIRNYATNITTYIGNECINHFIDDLPFCALCKIYRIPTRTSHYCSACARRKKDKPTGVLSRGKFQGKSYEEVFAKDKSYCAWCFNEKKGDTHFLAYLSIQYDRLKKEKQFSKKSIAEAPPS